LDAYEEKFFTILKVARGNLGVLGHVFNQI